MTKYIVNVSKWLPLETESAKQMYVECKKLKYSCINVCCELNYLISEYKRQDKKSLHYDNNNLLVEVCIATFYKLPKQYLIKLYIFRNSKV